MVAFLSSDVLIAFFILSLFLNETDTLTQLFLAVICDRALAELLSTCNQHVFGVLSQLSSVMTQTIHLCPSGDQDQIALLCYFTYKNWPCQLQKINNENSYFYLS